ncbi:MAG: GspH/FimT family pseudopilin [Longimicrobiales bacterium]
MNVRLSNRRRGFSLMEAIVVMALMGIIATIAFPAVERQLLATKVDRAAMVMAADMQHAFTLAARQRRPIRVNLDWVGKQMTIRDRQTNAILSRRHYGPELSPFALSDFDSSTGAFFVFPNGMANVAVTVTLGAGHQQRLVSMSRVGHVTIGVI